MEEKVSFILYNIKKSKSLGRWDTYNVAVTERRCIFAKLTADMLKKAASAANAEGKAEGKGFLSRWSDQMQVSLSYGDRYLNMAPEDVLRENPENFALDNSEIVAVKFRQKHQKAEKKGMIERVSGEVTFESKGSKFTCAMDSYPSKDIEQMRQILGSKVQ